MAEPSRPSDPFPPGPADRPDPLSPPATPLPTPVAVRQRSAAATVVNVLLGVALVVAVGGVAFAAGRATAPTTVAAGRTGSGQFGGGFGPNASGAPDRGGFGGFAGGGGGVSIQGTVTAISSSSLTLQLASGQSVTIPLDAQTTYHSRTAATAADVTSGTTVVVQLAGGGRLNGQGNGQGNQGNGQGNQDPAASGGAGAAGGGPGRGFGSASSITIVPAGS